MNNRTLAVGVAVALAMTVASQALRGQTVQVQHDRLTGRAYAYVFWLAVDSVGHDAYWYHPGLVAGCFQDGKIVVFVGKIPVQNERQRAQVKWDAVSEPKQMTMNPSNVGQGLFFEDGPDAIKNILLHTDTVLVRFRDVFGYVVTPEFHLGPADSVVTVLKSVATTCRWSLPKN